MVKITMTYTDYNGNERKEDLRFNLTQAELMKMEFTTPGGLVETVNRIMSDYDTKAFYELFEKILLTSYGVKSEDGRRFEKSPEISLAFSQTEAFSQLVMGFFNDPPSFNEFINQLVPQSNNSGNVVAMPSAAVSAD